MDMKKAVLILKTANLLGDMPAGEGFFTAAQAAYWTGISKSTIYRILPQLEQIGLLESEPFECRKINCKRYRITENGRDAVAIKKML